MLKLVSSNPSPKISSLRVRRHATSPDEAEEIFVQNSGHVTLLDRNEMPYTESQSELPEEDQPTLKIFRAGKEFRLTVFNFSADPGVPFIGFSIEREGDDADVFLEGSTRIIDSSKSGLTCQGVAAAIPLLYIFNAEIKAESKRAADLIAKASGNQPISLADRRNELMMGAALTATHNCMQALYGNEKLKKVEQPKTGTDCLAEKLHSTLEASSSFYDALFNRTGDLFEPSIRELAENVALGRLDVNKTNQVHSIS